MLVKRLMGGACLVVVRISVLIGGAEEDDIVVDDFIGCVFSRAAAVMGVAPFNGGGIDAAELFFGIMDNYTWHGRVDKHSGDIEAH